MKIKHRCLDCGGKMASRSKKTIRCMACHLKYERNMAHGRITGNCLKCGKKLSSKKNKTNQCNDCYERKGWNKGMHTIPWNTGKSMFKNKEEYRLHANKRRREIRNNNNKEKIADRLRTLIRNSIRHNTINRRKKSKTTYLIGCTIKNYIRHIEKQFDAQMTWGNYGNGHGKWNIDHIMPISKFNLNLIKEQKKAFNFKNCHPMWAIDNIKKGNKIQSLTASITF